MSTDVFAEEYTFQSNSEGQTADSLHSGGGVSKEGFYHVVCTGIEFIEEEENRLPHFKLSFEVLAGTESDQRDKKVYHRIRTARWETRPDSENGVIGISAPYDPNSEQGRRDLDGINAFAYAFSLVRDDDLGNDDLTIPFGQIEGKQAIAKIEKNSDWTGRDGTKHVGKGCGIQFNNQVWPLGHDEVRDVPKDPEALAMVGGIDGCDESAGNGSADFDDI